ncbi:MAG: hypothetical protein ACE5EX_00005, partial [Phycisphaerae bacterium]
MAVLAAGRGLGSGVDPGAEAVVPADAVGRGDVDAEIGADSEAGGLFLVLEQPPFPTGEGGLAVYSTVGGQRTADDFVFQTDFSLVAIEVFAPIQTYPDFETFYLWVWEDDGTGTKPIDPPVFESGGHVAGDGIFTVGLEPVDEHATETVWGLKFNFGSPFVVAEAGVKYWVGVTGTANPAVGPFAVVSSFVPSTGTAVVQDCGQGWDPICASEPPTFFPDVDMGMRLWSFAPPGGTTVLSMSGVSEGVDCPDSPGGCCVRVTPTEPFVSGCGGGSCPTSGFLGSDCFAEAVLAPGSSAGDLALALQAAFDNQAGCNAEVISAQAVGSRLIVTVAEGFKPKLCLTINGEAIGLVGGEDHCVEEGCGFDFHVGPTVTLPPIPAGLDGFGTVIEDCALPPGGDDGTWLDLDVNGSLFDHAGLPPAQDVVERLRLQGVARDFALDDAGLVVRRTGPFLFGRCSGDFSNPGAVGPVFEPDGAVDEADLAAFDLYCAGQTEPFAGDCGFFDTDGDDVLDDTDRDVLLCLLASGNSVECCPNRVDPVTGEPDLPQDASNQVVLEELQMHLRACEALEVSRADASPPERWLVDVYLSPSGPNPGAAAVGPCEAGDDDGANGNDIIAHANDLGVLSEGMPRRIGGEIGNTTDCDFAPFWSGDQDADVYRFALAFPSEVLIRAVGVEDTPECGEGTDGALTSLWLYDESATRLAEDDPQGAADPELWLALDPGVYFVLIASAGQVQEPLPNGFPPSFPDCSIAFAPEIDQGATDPTGFYDLNLLVLPRSRMRVTQESETGGTFESRMLIQPVIVYQKVCDPLHAVLVDTGAVGIDAFDIVGSGPWVKGSAGNADVRPMDAEFVPGLTEMGEIVGMQFVEQSALGFAARLRAPLRRACETILDTCAYAQQPDAEETLEPVLAIKSALVNFPVADGFALDEAAEIESVTFWVTPGDVVTGDHVFEVRVLGSMESPNGACGMGIPDESNVVSAGAVGGAIVRPTAVSAFDRVSLNLAEPFIAEAGVTYWVELSLNTAESPPGVVRFVTSLEGDGVFFHDVIPEAGPPGDASGDCAEPDGDGWDCDATADDPETDCDEGDPDGDQRTDGNLAFCVGPAVSATFTTALPSDVGVGRWWERTGEIVRTQPYAVRADGVVGFFSDLSLGDNGGNQVADSFTLFEETTIAGLRWRGVYTDNNPDFDADGFRIEFWSNAIGPFGVGVPQEIVAVYEPDNAVIERTPGPLTGDPGRQVFDYSVALDPPLTVAADETLWVSVINDTTAAPYFWAFGTSSGGDSDGHSALRVGLAGDPLWEPLPISGDPPTDFSFDLTVAGATLVICGDSVDGITQEASGLGYRFDPSFCRINGTQSTPDVPDADGLRWRNVSAPWKLFEVVPAAGASRGDLSARIADLARGHGVAAEAIERLVQTLPEGTVVDLLFAGVAAFDADPDVNGVGVGGAMARLCAGGVVQTVDPTAALSQGLSVAGLALSDGSAVFSVVPVVGPPPQILHEQGLEGQTMPFSGYIDPLAESTNGVDLNLGLTSAKIRFTEPVFTCGGDGLGVDNFVMTETGGGAPPNVTDVILLDSSYVEVTWDRPITLQEWTTIIVIDACDA